MKSEAHTLGYELLDSLGTLRAIDAVVWDALGEDLAIRAQAGPLGRRMVPVIWTVPRELVAELHSQLGAALSEIDTSEQPRQ